MKKIVALILAVLVIAVCFTGCGNMSMGMGNFSYEHVHFFNHQGSHCATIEKWYDNSTGIEVKTKEYDSIFLAEGCYMLFEDSDSCPWCNE